MEKQLEEKIYRIRGQRVMLDKDIAILYNVKARALRQQVKRNIRRFPPDFMFTLSDHEVNIMVSQFVTPSRKHFGGHLPYAFTQEGIAMLSSVLRSSKAVQVNIAIMRAFVKLRHALGVKKDLVVKIERLEGKVNIHDTDILLLHEDVHQLKKEKEPQGLILPIRKI